MYSTHVSGVSPKLLMCGRGSLQASAPLNSLGCSSQGRPLSRSLYDAHLLAPVSNWMGGLGGNPRCCGKQWCSIGMSSAEPRWTSARGLLKGPYIQSDISQWSCVISLRLLQGIVNLNFFFKRLLAAEVCTPLHIAQHEGLCMMWLWRIIVTEAAASPCGRHSPLVHIQHLRSPKTLCYSSGCKARLICNPPSVCVHGIPGLISSPRPFTLTRHSYWFSLVSHCSKSLPFAHLMMQLTWFSRIDIFCFVLSEK